MLSPRHDPPGDLLLDDTPEGERLRGEFGARFSEIMKREWRTIGIHLGYRYDLSTICLPDGSEAPPMDAMTYTQTARPGARAPHVWLGDGRSTLDLFGRGLVLLRLDPKAAGGDSLLSAARNLGVPLTVVELNEPSVSEVYQRALVLVRPDGHVAWRADHEPDDPHRVLSVVMARENEPIGEAGHPPLRV
jgi:hypothetical protein